MYLREGNRLFPMIAALVGQTAFTLLFSGCGGAPAAGDNPSDAASGTQSENQHSSGASDDATGQNSQSASDKDKTADDSQATIADDVVITVNPAVPPNTAPAVNAGPDQTVTLVATGGSNSVAGAYYEWDAAQDTDGDNTWPSTTANAYSWIFDSGNLSPKG